MEIILILLGLFCVSSQGIETYKAAVVISDKNVDVSKYAPLIHEAGKKDVDILVLPSTEGPGSEGNYDETVKVLSKAAKQAGLYVVAHLYEKARCENKNELIRSNLVFDRRGSVLTVYRKSVNSVANCTSISSDVINFTTDFGVTFGLLMEEDLVVKSLGLKQLKNYVMTGAWDSKIPFLSAGQFSSSWAYMTNANLIANSGIFAGKSGSVPGSDKLIVAVLNRNGGLEERSKPPVIDPSKLETYPGEDLSQYIIRPLDLEASSRGYKETVCHGRFCCEFYIKTSSASKQNEMNYGLAAFDGVRNFGGKYNTGTQNCGVFTCAGLYKRSCSVGHEKTLNVIFEEITITSNFTETNSHQYPVIISTDRVTENQFGITEKITSNSKQTTVSLKNVHLLSFGIFGRDFSKDFENIRVVAENSDGLTMDIYDYIYNENVLEFFDYLWIRLRILLLVVSIYILEMM